MFVAFFALLLLLEAGGSNALTVGSGKGRKEYPKCDLSHLINYHYFVVTCQGFFRVSLEGHTYETMNEEIDARITEELQLIQVMNAREARADLANLNVTQSPEATTTIDPRKDCMLVKTFYDVSTEGLLFMNYPKTSGAVRHKLFDPNEHNGTFVPFPFGPNCSGSTYLGPAHRSYSKLPKGKKSPICDPQKYTYDMHRKVFMHPRNNHTIDLNGNHKNVPATCAKRNKTKEAMAKEWKNFMLARFDPTAKKNFSRPLYLNSKGFSSRDKYYLTQTYKGYSLRNYRTKNGTYYHLLHIRSSQNEAAFRNGKAKKYRNEKICVLRKYNEALGEQLANYMLPRDPSVYSKTEYDLDHRKFVETKQREMDEKAAASIQASVVILILTSVQFSVLYGFRCGL
ncbi:hypothetical protein L596_027200 [Steinernema carpocapsae]|uniref:Uncharacterized protein n=1 Tax=Steinernema carpocapsae TaxID=34508 RepID=A0A4U5M3N2_STECR|nr:hypothetical protein L596_027200 [Steinernema carpocapsae]